MGNKAWEKLFADKLGGPNKAHKTNETLNTKPNEAREGGRSWTKGVADAADGAAKKIVASTKPSRLAEFSAGFRGEK